jgi:hypothetical protein
MRRIVRVRAATQWTNDGLRYESAIPVCSFAMEPLTSGINIRKGLRVRDVSRFSRQFSDRRKKDANTRVQQSLRRAWLCRDRRRKAKMEAASRFCCCAMATLPLKASESAGRRRSQRPWARRHEKTHSTESSECTQTSPAGYVIFESGHVEERLDRPEPPPPITRGTPDLGYDPCDECRQMLYGELWRRLL